ncbi:S8 family peptidase [Bosea sp. Root381]|uniref:S8 family peptidase n=1 Tax=Bosea sp. Root381 TaxID=1736524 RepID=UPI00138F4BF5|nr:S8 family peptidase [Bosea sp. Root381]
MRSLPSSVQASATASSFVTSEYLLNHGLAQINAAEAYALGFTGKGVLVAVVDSGLDTRLPEFAGRVSPLSRNFGLDGLPPTDVSDSDSHGTHVAGTIAANRDMVGMHGVAFNAQIMALRAIVDAGGDSAAAIEYAAANGARVMNGSFGPGHPERFLDDGSPNPDYVLLTQFNYDNAELQRDVVAGRRAAAADMVMVFAAGNARDDQPIIAEHPMGGSFFPAMRPSNADSGMYGVIDGHSMVDLRQVDFSDLQPYTLAVVAVDIHNKLASFSNKCGLAAAWCLAAPGVGIIATVPQGMGSAPG